MFLWIFPFVTASTITLVAFSVSVDFPFCYCFYYHFSCFQCFCGFLLLLLLLLLNLYENLHKLQGAQSLLIKTTVTQLVKKFPHHCVHQHVPLDSVLNLICSDHISYTLLSAKGQLTVFLEHHHCAQRIFQVCAWTVPAFHLGIKRWQPCAFL